VGKLRLLSDRIMVKLDKPLRKRDFGDGVVIHYPDGSHGSQDEINVWGEVLQTGPGKWAKRKDGTELGTRCPLHVAVGDKVMVVWYLTRVETQKSIQALIGKDTIIIQPQDVLCVDPA